MTKTISAAKGRTPPSTMLAVPGGGERRDDRAPGCTRRCDESDIVAYVQACADEDDPGALVAALGDVARERSMMQLAERAGVSRDRLYLALSNQGDPSYATVVRIARALGLKITITAA